MLGPTVVLKCRLPNDPEGCSRLVLVNAQSQTGTCASAVACWEFYHFKYLLEKAREGSSSEPQTTAQLLRLILYILSTVPPTLELKPQVELPGPVPPERTC